MAFSNVSTLRRHRQHVRQRTQNINSDNHFRRCCGHNCCHRNNHIPVVGKICNVPFHFLSFPGNEFSKLNTNQHTKDWKNVLHTKKMVLQTTSRGVQENQMEAKT